MPTDLVPQRSFCVYHRQLEKLFSSHFLLPFRRKHQEAAETAVQQLDREHDCPPCGEDVADR